MGCGSSSSNTSHHDNGPQPTSNDRSISDQSDQFILKSLQAHNEYRKIHGSVPLTHAPDLTAIAQKWANHLIRIGRMEHSPKDHRPGAGENLYMSWGSAGVHVEGNEAVDSWYDEIKDYDFSKGEFKPGTGHFTQVVWAESRELGVAKAFSADGKTVYVVANYRPAGNLIGAFKENVKPAQ